MDGSDTELILLTPERLGVITIDLLPGLLIAVMMSFVLVIYRASRPPMPKLEQIPDDGTLRALAKAESISPPPGPRLLEESS